MARREWARVAWVVLGMLLVACGAKGGATVTTPEPATPSQPLVVPTITPAIAPTRSLTLLDGAQVTLEAWRGRGVVLNFWATWCYPCRAEMPALVAMQEQEEGIVVVAVNYLETPDLAREFVTEFALPFPIVIDEQGDLARDLGVRGLPTTYFIDAEGRLVGQHVGPLNAESLTELVAQIRPSKETSNP